MRKGNRKARLDHVTESSKEILKEKTKRRNVIKQSLYGGGSAHKLWRGAGESAGFSGEIRPVHEDTRGCGISSLPCFKNFVLFYFIRRKF